MPSKSEAATETATFTVAKGRTVSHQPDPKSEVKHYGPGESLDLPIEEGERLRGLGFLLSEDGSPVVAPETAGPATVKGAEIKEG